MNYLAIEDVELNKTKTKSVNPIKVKWIKSNCSKIRFTPNRDDSGKNLDFWLFRAKIFNL